MEFSKKIYIFAITQKTHKPIMDIIQELDESLLYETRLELKEAEQNPKETGKINWAVWDKVSSQCKHDIEEELKDYNPPTEKTIFLAYDLDYNLKGIYYTSEDCADDYGISREAVIASINRNKPYKKGKTIFKRYRITKKGDKVIKIEDPRRKRNEKTS